MFEIFSAAANVVLPLVLVILLGYVLRSKGFLTDEFAKVGNKLVFRVGLSVSMFVSVYSIPDMASVPWNFVLYTAAAVLLIFGLGAVTAILTTRDHRKRGSILQCVYRSNFVVVGLSLATAMGGDEGAKVASVTAAFIVPLFNILAVFALSVFLKDKDQKKHSLKPVLHSVAKNPLIWGAIIGFVCILMRELENRIWGETVFSLQNNLTFLYKTAEHIKSMTTPFALLILGAQFRPSQTRGMLKEISVATLWRNVFAPGVGLGLAFVAQKLGLITCGAGQWATMIALFGGPVAAASGVMAAEMGSDEQLATQLIVWTSIVSIFTVFAQVCILMALGILTI